MEREPFIAHSELTNEIYIIVDKEKYRVTEQAIKAVKAINALEQEPRKGHWIVEIWNNREHHTCSECNHVVDYEPCYHYCPFCGAKMESEG